jgi:putative two-component system response regulator
MTAETKKRALSLGAKDFVTKPFDVTEVLLRIKNLLETRSLHLLFEGHNHILQGELQKRTGQLEHAQMETLERLALAAEFRDDDTGEHTQRVGRMAAMLAQSMGFDPGQVEIIRRAAPLHDIGKIGIPDGILLKPGRLTPEEFERIKTHTTMGARMLAGSGFSVLQMAEVIALTHHERFNGTGYSHLEGEAIPLPGRIVAVADVFDALTHERPYKAAWPVVDAIEEIERESGRQFDPAVVGGFLGALKCIDLTRAEEDRRSLAPRGSTPRAR